MLKSKIRSGFLVTLGYWLSPLSFWNDLYINIPLAYLFALPFGLISKTYFLPAMIFGYWITNILGFILVHKGATDIVSKGNNRYTKKDLWKDLLFSILYTLLIVLLVKFGILNLPTEYFQK